MLSLGYIAERNFRLFGTRSAVEVDGRIYTHAEFSTLARQLASGIRALGMKRQDRFSVLSMNNAEFLACYFAACHGNFILNTVNFRLAASEIQWILSDCSPKLLIFESQYTDTVASIRASLPNIEHWVCIGPNDLVPSWAASFESLLARGDPNDSQAQGGEDDLCCLMYTSGTTGKPKGVTHANRSMARMAEIISSELCLCGNTRMLAIAPLFHMGAASLSLAALYRGGTVVLHRGFDAAEVIKTIEHRRISAVHMVPTMLQAILDSPSFAKHDLSSLEMLMYAAAPMPIRLLKRALAAFGPITYNGYGQTEINMLTLLHPHQHHLDGTTEEVNRLSSVGQPHWQCEIRIADENGHVLPSGSIGEVVARSETSMTGYWNNSSATLATVRDGWVYTGDIGYLDAEGFLFLVDRKKDVIISGGENVYSREVEEALFSHPAVQDCAVIGVPDAKWGESVLAVVVLKSNATATQEELRLWCRSLIAPYKTPKRIEFVRTLPRIDTGKVSKVALREQFTP